jgi:hypothetical protein
MSTRETVAAMEIAALIGGVVFLSLAFGWRIGVGVACIAYWLKAAD